MHGCGSHSRVPRGHGDLVKITHHITNGIEPVHARPLVFIHDQGANGRTARLERGRKAGAHLAAERGIEQICAVPSAVGRRDFHTTWAEFQCAPPCQDR